MSATASSPAAQSQSGTGVHPSAIGSATEPHKSNSGVDETSLNEQGREEDPQAESTNNDDTDSEGYPEQKHAGAVGYGPEYGKGAVSSHSG